MSMDPCKAKPGDMIVFAHPTNGSDYDIKEAKELLVVGEQYEITQIEVQGFHTNIWLEGYEGTIFNSVMFDSV